VGRRPSWVTAATGRPAMWSPGRAPVANREHRLRFWERPRKTLDAHQVRTGLLQGANELASHLHWSIRGRDRARRG
jgi:hypothetical protein